MCNCKIIVLIASSWDANNMQLHIYCNPVMWPASSGGGGLLAEQLRALVYCRRLDLFWFGIIISRSTDSPSISTMCVSCQRWQMTRSSTLCHQVKETRRQSERRPWESDASRSGGDGVCFWLFWPPGNEERWHQRRCCALLSPRKWADYLWDGGGAQSSYTGTHEYRSGQRPCARWRRCVLEFLLMLRTLKELFNKYENSVIIDRKPGGVS